MLSMQQKRLCGGFLYAEEEKMWTKKKAKKIMSFFAAALCTEGEKGMPRKKRVHGESIIPGDFRCFA